MYKFYSYSMLRNMIKNGDTIAVNGNSLISKAIKFITKENISHTGIALWQDDRLFVVEKIVFCNYGLAISMPPK